MCDEGGSLKNGGNRFLSMHEGGGVRGLRRALRCLGRAETGGRSELQAFRKGKPIFITAVVILQKARPPVSLR